MNISITNNQPIHKNDELENICTKLREVEKTKNYKDFYSYLKTTKIPFIPCYEKDVKTMYQECFRVLHRIGEISIPVSVALSMHYYVLASMASFPFSKTSKQYWVREMLLKKIKNERLLIANTGSVRTFKNVSGNKSIVAEKEKDSYTINGEAPFMSLSGIADYMVFTASIFQDEKAVFFVPLDTDKIKFEDTAFGDAMRGSFTKSVRFENLNVHSTNVIKLDSTQEERCELLIYQRSWFQALMPGTYLGAAFRVLLEVKEFAQGKMKNGKIVSESESFLDNIGELMIKYKAACQLCEQAGISIEGFKIGNKRSLENMFEASALSKYFATHFSEDIITKIRHLMGSRFLSPNSYTNKVYKEIVFGTLQPMTDPDIKNYFSNQMMNNEIQKI
ncbi:hypothetical protein [Aquimarina sp. 2304DJ70-9]|uniref:hypothetical protein n=1 Tax=Aquimarina penaris TaxID=3231044 RepID=UPI0034621575